MRRNANRIWRRLGRRGCFLLFLAMLDLVYAYSLYSPPTTARQSPSLVFFAHVAPLWVWALAWLIPGILCAVQAFTRNDRAAFAGGMCIKVLWGTMYVVGGIAANLERAYVGAVIWLAFALVVGLISTWPEPTVEHRERIGRGR
jgi:hypothetical protein